MFQTLITLTRAAIAGADEEMEARNATAILAQHLREARRELGAAQGRIAALMAQEKQEARRADELDARIARRMEEGRRAMTLGEEELAGEIADDLLGLEAERDAARSHGAELARQVARLRRSAEAAYRQIKLLAADMRGAQSAEKIRRIDAATTSGRPAPDEGALARARDVAERMKERDVARADLAEAMATLRAETSLDDRLKRAGVVAPDDGRRAEILASFTTEGDDE